MTTPPRARTLQPAACDRIIIVGAGGFGREVLQWARQAWPDHASKIAGFLSADPDKLRGHQTTLPVLGSPEAFDPRPSDGLLLAIGIPGARRRVAEFLENRGAEFLTLIHPSAIVAPTAEIGFGTIICPYAIVSDAVLLGRFVLLNYFASLGHDATAGDFAVLSPYASLGGQSVLAEEGFLGLHASVAPGRRVGCAGSVSMGSTVMRDVPDRSLVHGVPGRLTARVVPHGE